jgi:hypothetical protein
MAKTYYTSLKVEHKLASTGAVLKAGLLLKVAKADAGLVKCTELYSDSDMSRIGGKTYYFTPEQCRMLMLKPSVDLDSVIEESIMICEATYC